MRFFVFSAALLLALAKPSQAEATWVNFGGISFHNRPGYNGFNPGLGLAHEIDDRYFVALGAYRNSLPAFSRYIAGGVQTRVNKFVRAGVLGGVVDGYHGRNNGRFAPVFAPLVSIRNENFGVNFIFVPPEQSGRAITLSLQLITRIP